MELYNGRPEDMLRFLDIEPGAVSIMGLMNDKDHASLKLKTSDVIEIFLPAVGHDYQTVHLVGEDD